MEVQLHSFLTFGARFGEWSASVFYRFTLIARCTEAWADSRADLKILGYEVSIVPSQENKTRILGGPSSRAYSRRTLFGHSSRTVYAYRRRSVYAYSRRTVCSPASLFSWFGLLSSLFKGDPTYYDNV